MADIVAFIEARLAEDEAVARKAAGLVGVGAEARYYTDWSYDREQFRVTTDGTSWINAKDTGDACGEHIARHDPARVLREIAAKRRVLARHHPADKPNYRFRDTDSVTYVCVGCGYAGDNDDPNTDDINECPELREAASVWSDHPDYDPAWRLED